ncbi:MAG: aldehyde dehydrogenase family protein [Cyanobacteriota/Melainabacteria group bacterium]
MAKVQEADAKLAEEAIHSARRAFDEGPWTKTSAVDRAKILFKTADLIEERAEQSAEVETPNGGKPIRESVRRHVLQMQRLFQILCRSRHQAPGRDQKHSRHCW